jgi:hypothetical protein
MFVLLIGIGTFSVFQVMNLEDQLDTVTGAIDKMDPRVKLAQYNRDKFYALTKDVLNLASRDPNADKIANDFRLRQLESLPMPNASSSANISGAGATGSLNTPTNSAPGTNAAPVSK